MSLASILAYLEPEHAGSTLKLAALAAKALDAHIDALVVKPDPLDYIPVMGEAMTGDLVEQMMAQTEKAGAERATAVRAHFDAAMLTERAVFLEVIGREADIIAQEGRTRALTVLSCGSDRQAISAALFETGRPALLAPVQPMTSIGQRVAVFWSDSQEAARAVWGALPFLREARQVQVITVGDDPAASDSLDRIMGGLKNAGVQAVSKLIEPDNDVDSALLVDAAAAMDADLIVMGAYSHSRLQEFVFGGVTHSVLDNLARPVFMAH